MMKLDFKSRSFRAIFARLVCLMHITLSIFVLSSLKKDLIYLIPTIGAILIFIEGSIVIIVFKGHEPKWTSSLFVIYIPTIVCCYWFLELGNVHKVLEGSLVRSATTQDVFGNLAKSVNIQIFFGIIILVRWLTPMSPHGLSNLLLKYFAIACDMLDFLTISQDITLSKNLQLVYWTLSVWSWSMIQFFIVVPKPESKIQTYITNSLLSVIFLDLPYFGIRIAAIFSFGSHSYNSYFFATKNLVLIMLQFHRERFLERDFGENSEPDYLRHRLGFDKEASKLFDVNEVAKRAFFDQRLAKNHLDLDLDSIQNSLEGLSDENFEIKAPADYENFHSFSNRVPRTIESVKHMRKLIVRGDKPNTACSIEDIPSAFRHQSRGQSCAYTEV